MRTPLFLLAGIVASLSSLSGAPAAATGPCTTATAACTEWVALAGGPSRSLIYRTHALDTRNENVRRALIMVHGTNRNADHYFTTATTAAFLGGALDDLLVRVEARGVLDGAAAGRSREDLALRLKGMCGLSAEIEIAAPGGVERSMGKARRVIDKRPKG